jgi:intracellular sulfur oxidation DsrE/DsrF family protein
MKTQLLSWLMATSLLFTVSNSQAAQVITPEYEEPQVVFDFFFDDPQHIASALYWVRSTINPLLDDPYNMAPEMMDVIVVIHGTEIVTLAKKNYEKYRESVERMRYYHSLGVQFRACSLAAQDYHYTPEDLYDFVDLVPSAPTDIVQLQMQGYALIAPIVKDKKFSIEEIR